MNADGSNQMALTNNTAVDNIPDWSPDGSKIAFQTNRDGSFDIYTMNPDGSNQTRLTTQAGDDFQASWSPDSTKLVFVTNRHGGTNQEIYTMNADGSNQARLTNNTSQEGLPSWKPNQSASRRVPSYDFDGDGKANVSVYRPSSGTWYLLNYPKRIFLRSVWASERPHCASRLRWRRQN